MASKVFTFKQLVDEEYIAKGIGLFDALVVIRGQFDPASGVLIRGCGVSVGSLRKAYHGTEIDKDNIAKLLVWFEKRYPKKHLDVDALLRAPQLKRPERLSARLRLRDVAQDPDGSFLVRLAPANDVAPNDVFAELATFLVPERKDNAG